MDLFAQRMNGNFGQPSEGQCYNCHYGKITGNYDQCTKCSKIEEFDKIDMEAIVADGDEKEELRIKMGELVKQMADAGLKPRVFLGKGDVKAQAMRYKKRVIEEKRFQCPKCEKLFTSNSGLKHHTANKVCEKVQQGGTHCDICDKTFSRSDGLKKHLGTKIHKQKANLD